MKWPNPNQTNKPKTRSTEKPPRSSVGRGRRRRCGGAGRWSGGEHDRGGGEFLASFLPSLYIHSVLQVLVGHLYIYIHSSYWGVTAQILYWSVHYSVYDYKHCCTQQAVYPCVKCRSTTVEMPACRHLHGHRTERGSPLPHFHLHPI